jgi:hypothetical protein
MKAQISRIHDDHMVLFVPDFEHRKHGIKRRIPRQTRTERTLSFNDDMLSRESWDVLAVALVPLLAMLVVAIVLWMTVR